MLMRRHDVDTLVFFDMPLPALDMPMPRRALRWRRLLPGAAPLLA